MRAVNVTVGVQNEFAAVFVALPFSDHLHINATLDCARDEHSPKRKVTILRQMQSAAGIPNRFFRVLDLEQALVRCIVAAPAKQERF